MKINFITDLTKALCSHYQKPGRGNHFNSMKIKNALIPEESDFVAREVQRHQINDVLFVLQY